MGNALRIELRRQLLRGRGVKTLGQRLIVGSADETDK